VPKPAGFPILTVASRDDPHLELVEPSKPARVLDKSPRSPAGMMVNRAFYGAVLLPARRHMRKEGAALAHGPGRGQYLLGKRKVVALRSPSVMVHSVLSAKPLHGFVGSIARRCPPLMRSCFYLF
jgi:hypothetical protein